MRKLKAIMASVVMLVAVMVMSLGSQEAEAKRLPGEVVRKPVAKLCDSGTRFWTDCSGSGDGCDFMDCDGNDGPEDQ